MVPLPQVVEQSESSPAQPDGQQPSPSLHSVIACRAQATLQVAALPVRMSTVHSLPSSQLAGQSPSQVSPLSTIPLLQVVEQSESVPAHPAGQQPSPAVHWETEAYAQL